MNREISSSSGWTFCRKIGCGITRSITGRIEKSFRFFYVAQVWREHCTQDKRKHCAGLIISRFQSIIRESAGSMIDTYYYLMINGFYGGAMEIVVQVCQIISGISAAIAIIVSIVFYRRSLNRERKTDTLRNLSVIRRKYFNTKRLDDDEKLQYVNELEYFATGINEKVYDIAIVKKMSGSRLVRQYDNWAKDFIMKRRDMFGNSKTYCEYENMIKDLKAMLNKEVR